MPFKQPSPEPNRASALEEPLPFPTASRETFILRLWRGGEDAIWVGQIQHVASGQVIATGNFEDLLKAAQDQLDTLTSPQRGLR